MSFLQSFFGSKSTATESASAVDVVLYVASLASEPKEIDPLLDGLRDVTANLGTEQQLSGVQQQKLAVVYAQLVAYLVTKESLRSWTRQDIEDRVAKRFTQNKADEATFWQAIQH